MQIFDWDEYCYKHNMKRADTKNTISDYVKLTFATKAYSFTVLQIIRWSNTRIAHKARIVES